MSTLVNKIKQQRSRAPYYKLRKKFQTKHKHAYTMLILSLFTMSFFGFFALRPTLVTIATLNRQIKDSREIDKRLTEKLNLLVQAQAEYEVIAPFLPKINQAIPDHPEYADLLMDIENMRDSSVSAVAKFGLGSVELKAENPGKVDLSVEAEGDYLSLEDFIALLLSNARLLVVNSLNFDSGSQSGLGLAMDVNAPYALSNNKPKLEQQDGAMDVEAEQDIIQ